ncbi:MAG: hypothetical protein QHG98_07290 [Methanothrix sp.]|nr:hypothetical protein [Methanothrix sp.]
MEFLTMICITALAVGALIMALMACRYNVLTRQYDVLMERHTQVEKVVSLAIEDNMRLLLLLEKKSELQNAADMVAKLMKLSKEEAERELQSVGLDALIAKKAACIRAALATVVDPELILRLEKEIK